MTFLIPNLESKGKLFACFNNPKYKYGKIRDGIEPSTSLTQSVGEQNSSSQSESSLASSELESQSRIHSRYNLVLNS